MKTEFIPYEQALALKELGFDEPCFGWFTNSYLRIGSVVENKHVQGEDETLAPLYQQAFRWFREKYNISYSIDWMSRSSEFYNGYYVHFRGINDNKINQENFIVLNDELPSKGYKVYKTYEEAELACLKKLIEIVNK
jgi:hypothetical protein